MAILVIVFPVPMSFHQKSGASGFSFFFRYIHHHLFEPRLRDFHMLSAVAFASAISAEGVISEEGARIGGIQTQKPPAGVGRVRRG